jgi:uncharacterized membrane protein YphA (DoxX/SURF4 family)
MSDGPPQRAGWAGGRGRGWAGARFGSPVSQREAQAIAQTTAPAESAPSAAPPEEAPSAAPLAGSAPAGATSAGWRAAAEQAGDFAARWAPTAGRILLGLVLAWFGYHELLLPGEWTGYVPVINETSNLAIIAVLVHGWVLLVLAVALIAGVAPRVSAAIASVLLLEIVISLSVSGLSDTSMRDAGVLGLAICLTGARNQRLVLRG